jgi:hypothetical protein
MGTDGNRYGADREGERGGGQNKRQDVNTSVEPGNFAMYKRQIMCQKASGERQKGVTTDVKLMAWTARSGVLALPGGGVYMYSNLTVRPLGPRFYRAILKVASVR